MPSIEKKRKIASSLCVVGSIVAVFLLVVVGYQALRIANLKKQKEEYTRLWREYQVILEEGENDLDYYHSEYYLRWLARTYGYTFPEDKVE